MKKIFTLFVLALAMLGLTACSSDETVSDAELAQNALDGIVVSTSVTTDFTLSTGTDSVLVTWSSDNSAITISGGNATVTRGETDITVTLTATASLNDVSIDKTYSVIVKEAPASDAAVEGTVAYVYTLAVDDEVTVTGVVSGFIRSVFSDALSYAGFYITDETGSIYVYDYSISPTLTVGDEITIDATVAEYNSVYQLSSATLVETVSTGNEFSQATVVQSTVADVIADLEYHTMYELTVYVDQDETYGSYSLYDGDDKLGIYLSGSGTLALQTEAYGDMLGDYVGKCAKVLFILNSNTRGIVVSISDTTEVVPGPGESTDTDTDVDTDVDATVISIEDFLAAEEGDTYYQLTGVISSIASTTYGNLYLVDESDPTISVYVYGLTATQLTSNDKSFESLGLVEGDIITISGLRSSYSGSAQAGSSYFVSKVESVSITELLATEEGDTYYRITGIVSNISSTTYGNFYLVDENDSTVSIYVYGLTATKVSSNDKSFDTLGISEGDSITIIGTHTSYNDSKQIGGIPYLVSINLSEDGTVAKEYLSTYENPFSAEAYTEATTVTLVASTDATITLTYETSDSALVSVDDLTVTITMPASGQETVTFTVIATYNGASYSVDYEITVGTLAAISVSEFKALDSGELALVNGTIAMVPENETDAAVYFIITDGVANLIVYFSGLDYTPVLGANVAVTGTNAICNTGTIKYATVSTATSIVVLTDGTTYTAPAATVVDFSATDFDAAAWLATLTEDDYGTEYVLLNVEFLDVSGGLTATYYSYFANDSSVKRGGLYHTDFAANVNTEDTFSFSCFLVGTNGASSSTTGIIRFTNAVEYTA